MPPSGAEGSAARHLERCVLRAKIGHVKWNEWQVRPFWSVVCQAPVPVCKARHGLHWISSAVTSSRSAVRPCEKCHETSRKWLGCQHCLRSRCPAACRAPQALLPSGATQRPEMFAGCSSSPSARAVFSCFLPWILEDPDPNVKLWNMANTRTSPPSCIGGGRVSWAHTVHPAAGDMSASVSLRVKLRVHLFPDPVRTESGESL